MKFVWMVKASYKSQNVLARGEREFSLSTLFEIRGKSFKAGK
jgi:hypothetical protein